MTPNDARRRSIRLASNSYSTQTTPVRPAQTRSRPASALKIITNLQNSSLSPQSTPRRSERIRTKSCHSPALFAPAQYTSHASAPSQETYSNSNDSHPVSDNSSINITNDSPPDKEPRPTRYSTQEADDDFDMELFGEDPSDDESDYAPSVPVSATTTPKRESVGRRGEVKVPMLMLPMMGPSSYETTRRNAVEENMGYGGSLMDFEESGWEPALALSKRKEAIPKRPRGRPRKDALPQHAFPQPFSTAQANHPKPGIFGPSTAALQLFHSTSSYATNSYYIPGAPLPSWSGFSYSPTGELSEDIIFDKPTLNHYIQNHPLGTELVVWLQRQPAKRKQLEHAEERTKCRYHKCRAGNTISVGHFRVVFDEVTGRKDMGDPVNLYLYAACFHLGCFEELYGDFSNHPDGLADLVLLHDVRVDERADEEGPKPFTLERGRIRSAAFIWLNHIYENPGWKPSHIDESLEVVLRSARDYRRKARGALQWKNGCLARDHPGCREPKPGQYTPPPRAYSNEYMELSGWGGKRTKGKKVDDCEMRDRFRLSRDKYRSGLAATQFSMSAVKMSRELAEARGMGDRKRRRDERGEERVKRKYTKRRKVDGGEEKDEEESVFDDNILERVEDSEEPVWESMPQESYVTKADYEAQDQALVYAYEQQLAFLLQEANWNMPSNFDFQPQQSIQYTNETQLSEPEIQIDPFLLELDKRQNPNSNPNPNPDTNPSFDELINAPSHPLDAFQPQPYTPHPFQPPPDYYNDPALTGMPYTYDPNTQTFTAAYPTSTTSTCKPAPTPIFASIHSPTPKCLTPHQSRFFGLGPGTPLEAGFSRKSTRVEVTGLEGERRESMVLTDYLRDGRRESMLVDRSREGRDPEGVLEEEMERFLNMEF